jgi:hypothetical protein
VLQNSPDHYQVFQKDGPFKMQAVQGTSFNGATEPLNVWFREADYPAPVKGHIPSALRDIVSYFHYNNNLAEITIMVNPADTEVHEYDRWFWVPILRYIFGWETCTSINEHGLMTLVFKQASRLSELMEEDQFFDPSHNSWDISF